MKKVFVIGFIAIGVYACSGSETKEEKTQELATEAAPAAAAAPNTSPDYEKGLSLIAQNDCLTCHKVDEKVTGPAYRDVANKYPDNEETIDYLANKIIKGGAGVWGTVPMTPHPTLSDQDAQTMARYILLLKKK
ncbi:c-type cytochrome [Segetibacter sp. 3557_3]|uniref:c-type cytochrome n=1 Tax=Segetibacter sp. 3557_3 TaxID=2547429 RepID=UPI0010591132|nr:c-type cytochrome [Segetibacter sp. 3557_3]TDH25632.1 c-type cytochrome [Segetibacter sp. 3557_3]